MRFILTSLVFIFIANLTLLQGQNDFWSIATAQKVSHLNHTKNNVLNQNEYKVYQLDFDALKQTLTQAPLVRNSIASDQAITLQIPLPNGAMKAFQIVESPVMMPGIAARYDNIKTYAGKAVDGSTDRIRFSVSPKGFYAAMSGPTGSIYIDPYDNNQQKFFTVYYTKDLMQNLDYNFNCGVSGDEVDLGNIGTEVLNGTPTSIENRADGEVEFLDYRLAIACTGEWGASHGGTVASALEDMVLSVNRINLVMEQNLAMHLNLIDENDQLIHLNGAEDPYTDPQEGGSLLGQNTFKVNAIIGENAYDIGHIYTNSCTDVGGIAALASVCGDNKGAGVTCHYSNDLMYVAVSITCHEIGHQFAASHTFNNCGDNIAPSTAYEPGSGTTIMSYCGLCGSQNVQSVADDYYHVSSLEQMYQFTRLTNGYTCAEKTLTGNTVPVVSIDLEDDFYIPISTPFELTGNAVDAENDNMIYSWEQFNTGPVSDLGTPQGNAPAFRVLYPNESPTRVFPSLDKIINGVNSPLEVLPTYSRDFRFKFVARDDNSEGVGVAWDDVEFHATDEAGPFVVNHPVDLELEIGEYYQLNWDVANTNLSPVNCQEVNITLSMDGGYTYPYTLAEEVPNIGYFYVTMPLVESTTARFRVEAADNIFFNISPNDFVIGPASEPGFTLELDPFWQRVCLPDNAEISLSSVSILNFAENVSFTEVTGLPENAVVNYGQNPFVPGQDNNITIDMSNVTEAGDYELEFLAITESMDSVYRFLNLEVISNDYSSFTLNGPTNGSAGVDGAPEFNWEGAEAADYYVIELNTSPTFEEATMIASEETTETTWSYIDLLEVNELFYWRVRPYNICGGGAYSDVWAFHTESLTCNAYENGENINIPSAGTPTVFSTITIESSGSISDLNIPKLKGSHNTVRELDVYLESPAGTQVELFSQICFNTGSFDLKIDDDGLTTIPCPPVSPLAHRPEEELLSTFNGEDQMGTWKLLLTVNDNLGSGGLLDEWSLQICSGFSLNAPYLVTNEVMPVAPASYRIITSEFLEISDDDNAPSELRYTIVELPEHGSLQFNYIDSEVDMVVGSQFTASFLAAGGVQYTHDGSAALEDAFRFVVEDNNGGFYGADDFNVVIDDQVMVGLNDPIEENSITIYPNPAGDYALIDFQKPMTGDLDIVLYTITGQVVTQLNVAAEQLVKLNTKDISDGMYLVKINQGDQSFTRKLQIIKKEK